MRTLKQTLSLTWEKIVLAGLAFAIALMPILAIAPNIANAQPNPSQVQCPPGFRCEESSLGQIFYTVATWALAIAFILAVIMLIYGGLRYIMAGGNEDSAKAGRQAIFNALIGIIIIVLSFIVVRIVYNFVSGQGGGGIFGT